jgi:hypothetical protein
MDFQASWLELTKTRGGFQSYITDQEGWETEHFASDLPRLIDQRQMGPERCVSQ